MELKQRSQEKKLWKSLKLQLVRQAVKKPFSKKPRQYLYQKKRVTGGARFLYAQENRIIETIPENFESKMANGQDNNRISTSMVN